MRVPTILIGATAAVVAASLLGLSGSAGATQPSTALHLAGNGNFDNNGTFLPGALGFNLADVSDKAAADSLPAGVVGIEWIGTCDGATSSFRNTVDVFAGDRKVYALYLMDEPDPSGCPKANLKAESDYVHAHLPGVKTFLVENNLGSDQNPSFIGDYTPANTGLDLYGIDPYPCRTDGDALPCDYSVIGKSVAAANAAGIPTSKLVPVYQVFGNGAALPWTMPTAGQESAILDAWGAVVPSPAFDYVYSYGLQYSGETALVNASAAVKAVFAAHNGGTPPPPTTTTTATTVPPTTTTAPSGRPTQFSCPAVVNPVVGQKVTCTFR